MVLPVDLPAYERLERSQGKIGDHYGKLTEQPGYQLLDCPDWPGGFFNCAFLLELPDSRVDAVVGQLGAHFGTRDWSVRVTKFSLPPDLPDRLGRLGLEHVRTMYQLVWTEKVPVWLNPSCNVRQVRTEELPNWAQLALACADLEPEFHACLTRACRLAARTSRFYIVELDSHPVGTAQADVQDGVTNVYWVGTLPSYRRRGAATAAMERVIQDFLVSGSDTLALQTDVFNPAQHVFFRMGFRSAYQWRFWERR